MTSQYVNNITSLTVIVGQDSVVSVATHYGVDSPGSIPGGGPPSSCRMATGFLSQG